MTPSEVLLSQRQYHATNGGRRRSEEQHPSEETGEQQRTEKGVKRWERLLQGSVDSVRRKIHVAAKLFTPLKSAHRP